MPPDKKRIVYENDEVHIILVMKSLPGWLGFIFMVALAFSYAGISIVTISQLILLL